MRRELSKIVAPAKAGAAGEGAIRPAIPASAGMTENDYLPPRRSTFCPLVLVKTKPDRPALAI
jgi:hypothetical protein